MCHTGCLLPGLGCAGGGGWRVVGINLEVSLNSSKFRLRCTQNCLGTSHARGQKAPVSRSHCSHPKKKLLIPVVLKSSTSLFHSKGTVGATHGSCAWPHISAPVSRGRGVSLSKGSPTEHGVHSVSQPPPTELLIRFLL